MGTISGFIDFATQTASYINGSWQDGVLWQGAVSGDSEPRYGYIDFEKQLGAMLAYNVSAIRFNITNMDNTPKTLTFYSCISKLNKSLTGRAHMGQRLGSITIPPSGSHTVSVTGNLFHAMKNEMEFGRWRFILYDDEMSTSTSNSSNCTQLGSMHISVDAEPRHAGNGSGIFYSPYVNIAGGKVDPYRRYRVEWTAQSGIVNWKLYCEGHEPLKPNYFVKIWNMKLGVEVGANTVIHEVSSTTVVVDKQLPDYASVADWSNKATTWTSGASSAELYKINARWGNAGERRPLDGCLIARGQFTLMGDIYDFAFTWSDVHFDSSYNPHTKRETFSLENMLSYTVTFNPKGGSLPVKSITVFAGSSIVLPGSETYTPLVQEENLLYLKPKENSSLTSFKVTLETVLTGWHKTDANGNPTGDQLPLNSLYTPTANISLSAWPDTIMKNNSVADLPLQENYTEESAPFSITCTSAYEWDNQPDKIVTGKVITDYEFHGWMWNEETGEILDENMDLSELEYGSILQGLWSETRKGVSYDDLPIFEDQYDVPAGTPVALNLDVNGGNPIETPIIKNFLADRYFGGYTLVHDSGELVSSNTEFFEDTTLYAKYSGYDTEGPTFQLPKVYRQSHELVHWIDDEGNTYNNRAFIGPIYQDLNLTAIWRKAPSRAIAYIFTNKF